MWTWVNKPLAKAVRLRDVGRTTLHEAAKLGNLDICRLITANTEDSNPKTVLGVTPLQKAAEGGHLEVCQLLLDNIETKNTRNKNGQTPLHTASHNSTYPPYGPQTESTRYSGLKQLPSQF